MKPSIAMPLYPFCCVFVVGIFLLLFADVVCWFSQRRYLMMTCPGKISSHEEDKQLRANCQGILLILWRFFVHWLENIGEVWVNVVVFGK